MDLRQQTVDMLRTIGRYQGILRVKGALSAQEQEERGRYIQSLPKPLRDMALAWVGAGRYAALRPVGRAGCLAVYPTEDAEVPVAAFAVEPGVADAVQAWLERRVGA